MEEEKRKYHGLGIAKACNGWIVTATERVSDRVSNVDQFVFNRAEKIAYFITERLAEE